MLLGRITVLVLVASAATLPACKFAPQIDANGFECKVSGDCPPDYQCAKSVTSTVGVCCNQLDPMACLPPPEPGPDSGSPDLSPDVATVPDSPVAAGMDSSVPNVAVLAVDRPTVNLGTLDVGATAAGTVTVTNTGNAVSGAVTVTASAGVTATGCSGTLAAGKFCTLTITATPTVAGAFSGTVSISANPGTVPPLVVSVIATATAGNPFSVSPPAIDLGIVAVGATAQAFITVQATTSLTGLTVSKTGADLKIDAASTCTSMLAAGATCAVVVDFTAAVAGIPTGNAVLVSQGGFSKSVPVTANVLTPAKLAAAPPSATLVAAPGGTSTSLDINVGNTGGMTTGQLGIALGGVNAADFRITGDKCSIVTLAGGASCAVTVVYAPAAAVVAAEAATLTITDKGPGASVTTVPLTGTPMLPAMLTITPATRDLGSVSPGSSSAEVLFTVTNTSATPSGALTVAVNSTYITISSNTCATKATLIQNDTCTIGLRLTPPTSASPQAISTLLAVTGASASASASVTGAIVTGPQLSATPPSVNFGSVFVNQSSPVNTVTIKNTGATSTGALSVVLAGSGAAQVAITGNTCTGSLAPGANCTISVRYSPTDPTGVNGTIMVSDGSVSTFIAMVGTGLAPATISINPNSTGPCSAVSPTSPCFNDTAVGGTSSTITFTVTADADTGAATATLSGTNAPDFAIMTNACTLALMPGQSCTVAVAFIPSAVGLRQASLTVTTSKGGMAIAILQGNGLAMVEIEPLSADSGRGLSGLDFGQRPLLDVSGSGPLLNFRVHVRGPNSASAHATTVSVSLIDPSTPADFSYPSAAGPNPCTGASFDFAPTPPAVVTATPPWVFANGEFTCDFAIEFRPQSSKGNKTATLTASGSNGGSDSKTLAGTATSPLTITPSPVPFGAVSVGYSSTTVTLTVANRSSVFVLGPLSMSLAGANANQFSVTADGCTALTLAAGATCSLSMTLVPTSPGTKNATLTVSASGESATVDLTGTGTAP
jgi:hypothetical protein